jgi:hypothetical protein
MIVALFTSSPVAAQKHRTSSPQQDHGLIHRCIFNRPCNWTSHAAIASGVVFGLHELKVRSEYALAASALLYIGKEVRDHLKWGNVLGTYDSNGDVVSGVLGAYISYRLVKHMERKSVRPLLVPDGAGTTLGLEIDVH